MAQLAVDFFVRSEGPVNHPTDEKLRAGSLGQLGDEDLTIVSAHLAGCPECCRRIDELGAEDALLARLKQSVQDQDQVLVSATQRQSAIRALRRSAHPRQSRYADATAQPGVPTASSPAPKEVGEYDILAEVGRGGMGVVYKARHRRLHRLVALKMVLFGEFTSPAQEMRFRLEAELAARVRHANIVQVYEIGTHEGRPYMALEWVEGGNLACRLDGKPWPPNEAAALVETLARAIHVAHVEGVVHRDLKPANILLQRSEFRSQKSVGVQASALLSDLCPPTSDLCPKITDFGLAQPVGGDQILTHSGFLVGTPGYMAPEQAAGKRALVGPATDVYALGVILYQLLTGQLPFQGDSTLEVLRAVTNDEPPRPRRLQPHLPRDLEAITLHCLEKEPTRRYPGALALAEDLARFWEGKPVLARPVGAIARVARACRRRPLVTLLLALLTASLIGGLAGVTWKWVEANDQRDQANASARRADDEKKAALYQTYRARIAAAVAALAAHDVVDAARQLDDAPAELRGWEWRHLRSRLDDSYSVTRLPAEEAGFLQGAPDRLQAGALTADGERVVDLESGETRTLLLGPQRGRSFMVAPTRRGLRVVAWLGNGSFDLLDDSGQALCHVNIPDGTLPGPVAVSPDGTRLACVWYESNGLQLTVLDAASGKRSAVCERHLDGSIWALAFSPDGTQLASAGEDQVAHLWDPASGALRTTCRGHTDKLLGVAFRPDGKRLVTTSADGTVRQWDAADGREVEPAYDRHSGEVVAAVYSPDGAWVASAGTDRTVRVWRAQGRHDVAALHGHTGTVTGLAFAPDGKRLASFSGESRPRRPVGAGDGTVRVWDVDTRATLPALRGHTSYVYPVAFSLDGRWLASGSWDNTVRLWDAATGEPCATLPHPGAVWGLAFGPDGTWLVTATNADNRLRIWDVVSARVRTEIAVSARNFRTVTVSPDGTKVVATVFDPESVKHHTHVYDVASGKRLSLGEGLALAYSPDARWLAVRTADEKGIVLLNALTHQPAAQFPGHEKVIVSATFSPDSRWLASCSVDRTVRLWRTDRLGLASPSAAGEGVEANDCRVLRGHTDEVFAAAFHPDGTRLATAGRDRAVWLWDLTRDEPVARLPGHTSYVWSLAFSPDGETLASGSGDFTVRLWDTQPLKARYQARREATTLRPEAERLVEQLLRQKKDLAAGVEAIRSDPALSEPLRQAAIRVILRRAQPPQANDGSASGRR
jgi:WD40 repeat protein/serine/threonine protein kinase